MSDLNTVKPEEEEVKVAVDPDVETEPTAPEAANADEEGHDEVGTSLQRRMQAEEEAS
jgi:hypothetical protein